MSHRDFDAVIDDRNGMRGEGSRRGRTQRAAVPDIEGGAMKRTDEPTAAQAPLVEPRIGVCADIVDGKHTALGIADDDLAATRRAGMHLSFGQVREREGDRVMGRHGIRDLEGGFGVRL